MPKTNPRILELERENATLRRLIVPLAAWARRYCDGRSTYATNWYNEIVRELIKLGIKPRPDPACGGQVWARDGGGRAFDGLTDDEAADIQINDTTGRRGK